MESSKSNLSTTGSCLCKTVQFTINADPVTRYLCHCSTCKKTSGSAFMHNWGFRQDASSHRCNHDLLQLTHFAIRPSPTHPAPITSRPTLIRARNQEHRWSGRSAVTAEVHLRSILQSNRIECLFRLACSMTRPYRTWCQRRRLLPKNVLLG